MITAQRGFFCCSSSLYVGGLIYGVYFVIICHYLLLISSSFGVSERLRFVIVAFFLYLHIYFCETASAMRAMLGVFIFRNICPFLPDITKTCLFKYIASFTTRKWKFSDKTKSDIFHISAQNIDCGYLLEPPLWGSSNEYILSMFLRRNKKKYVYPCKTQFYYI